MVLHNQIDGLFSNLKERAANEVSPARLGVNKDQEFKIVIIGDSTMQVTVK